MAKNTFYGSSQLNAISYMEFGSIDLKNGKKNIWDFRLHDKAYDWLMHARYSNDIYAYLVMIESLKSGAWDDLFTTYNAEMHHGNDASLNLAKVLALVNAANAGGDKDLSFFEIGQTLFGCIDGMEFYQALLRKLNFKIDLPDLKMVNWYGVDISPFFNRLAETMHQQYRIHTMTEMDKLPPSVDVFFAKGVTLLYACDSTDKFFEIIERGRFGVFDYSFSLNGVQEVIIGTGKSVLYLDYNEFRKIYQSKTKKLFVRKGTSKIDTASNRLWVDCIYGDEEMIQSYIALDTQVREQLASSLGKYTASDKLLDRNAISEWVEIDQFAHQ